MHNSLQAELKAACESLAIGLDDTLSLLAVSGPDAGRYLHSRTTQDINALQEGEGAYAAILDKGAHVLSYFSIHQTEDVYWLLIPKAAEAATLAELEKYRIVEQATFTPRASYIYRVSGVEASAYMQQTLGVAYDNLPEMGAIQLPMGQWADSLVIRLPLTDAPGWVWCIPYNTQPPVPSHASSLSLEAIQHLLLESGQPTWGVDFDATTLLPETGLETQSVSYTKGCYLGQETVARVKTYGSVQKRLMGLTFSMDAPLLPVAGHPVVLQNGLTVGRFGRNGRSDRLQQGIALAYLDKTHRTPGQVLSLDINGQATDATVVTLPFVGTTANASADPASQLTDLLTRFAKTPETDSQALDEIATGLSGLLTQNPGYADAIEALGVLRSRQGRYVEAIALMEQLLQHDPNRSMAHTNMSIYWLKLGDKEKAEEEKAKATVLAMRVKMQQQQGKPLLEPEQDEALRKHQQQLRERIELFHHALNQYPDDPLGNFGLASAYLELNEPFNAIPYFEKAITGQPNHSVAYLSLGKCYEATQQWVNASATYEKGIAVAAKRGDQMPLGDMQQRMERLKTIISPDLIQKT